MIALFSGILLAMAPLLASPAQTITSSSGIFIMTTPNRNVACPNELKMIIGEQKVCLSRKPIIAGDEITYATDIQYDPRFQMHYIDIGLSATGGKILAQTIRSLPNEQYALVLEGQVICILELKAAETVRSVRIGKDIPLNDLTAIHDVLKTVKFK